MEDKKLFDNRKLEDHFTAKVEADSPEGKWEGQEIEVKSDPLIDIGQGKPIVIRIFEFAMKPGMKRKEMPKSKQDIFNAHALQIKHFLWKDGLIPVESINPRVVISRSQLKYRIFVTCEARYQQMWMDKARTIQDVLKPA